MILTEPTPNPNSIKFISEKVISAVGTEEFQKKELSKIENNFVKEILGFKGVELVLLSKNFLSVKKIVKLHGIFLNQWLFLILTIIFKKTVNQF